MPIQTINLVTLAKIICHPTSRARVSIGNIIRNIHPKPFTLNLISTPSQAKKVIRCTLPTCASKLWSSWEVSTLWILKSFKCDRLCHLRECCLTVDLTATLLRAPNSATIITQTLLLVPKLSTGALQATSSQKLALASKTTRAS